LYQSNLKTAMKKNMGSADRMIRAIIAIILGALYFTGTIAGTAGLVLVVIAIVFLLTSFLGLCPLYTVFGIKTCRTEPKKT